MRLKTTSADIIGWKLNEVMEQHDIKGVELARALDVTPARISTLRNSKEMPVNGARAREIAKALTGIIKRKGGSDKISARDLITC